MEHMSVSPQPQVLVSGRVFVESARWHHGQFWFSDWGTQEIIAIDEDERSEVVVQIAQGPGPEEMAPGPLCFDFSPDGRMLIVCGRKGHVLVRQPDGALSTHADLSRLSRFPWNDIAVDGRGNAYVGNTGFEFPGGEFAPGMIALVTPDGAAREVAAEMAFPNGMVVTPDGSTLIVAESYGQKLTAFTIVEDGGLQDRRTWAALDGYPDGICLDAENAVWYADVPNKRCVRVREGGEVLATVNLDRGCFSCALSGERGNKLFVVTAEWHGARKMFKGPRTGQVVALEVPVAGKQ
jgi:sugar lactone lactonase YvrE